MSTAVTTVVDTVPERRVPKVQTSWGVEFAAFEGNPDFVLSLARGLRVIESFHRHSEGLSIAELSRLTKLSRAAVRRILITLQLLGHVHADGRSYQLRNRAIGLGAS
jgi:IclR family pca regulon transcriptional regulator